ncbi:MULTISPECIES: hypothetical protein [Sphingobium]|uniref:hypothetical protein n=1 Tax=Sphingobium TaxID=165695 RepID=UPI000DBB6595|nr:MULTISPECIES: hypothetical protein [Sphingobium]KAA9019285.1 hypothetical protein F4U94_03905 [Sphingobium limneticum]BBD01879.1 hypothetical protein YGS_C1P3134 [Sphingobium sp. YG1]
MAFDIISFLERSTQEQCRELGNLLLEYAEIPRGQKMQEQMILIRSMMPPEDQDMAAAIERGRNRVRALSNGMRADGMDHQALIEAELKRRGDTRTFEQYRDDIGGVHSDAHYRD